MKLKWYKSKTPFLDLSVASIVTAIFYYWLIDLMAFWFLGDSANEKFSETNKLIFIPKLLIFCSVPVMMMVASIYLARYIATKYFGVATGDESVEREI